MEFKEQTLLEQMGLSKSDLESFIGKKRSKPVANEYEKDAITIKVDDEYFVCIIKTLDEKYPNRSTAEYANGKPIEKAYVECKVNGKWGLLDYIMIDSDMGPKKRTICRRCRMANFGMTPCTNMKSVRFVVDDEKTMTFREMLGDTERLLNNI